MMANGLLVRVLIRTDVTKYLQFKAVDGSYVFKQATSTFGFTSTVNVSNRQVRTTFQDAAFHKTIFRIRQKPAR